MDRLTEARERGRRIGTKSIDLSFAEVRNTVRNWNGGKTPIALPIVMAQQMQMSMSATTTTTMNLSGEYTETAVGGERPGGGTKLKRASSWRKFKDTVKGWVGQPGEQPQDPSGVPSAVNPSRDVTRATTCVNTVLRSGGNCYSQAGGATLPQSSPPRSDVPSILVTYDEPRREPSRPPRRSESLRLPERIRPSVSTPDVSNEAEEAAAAKAIQRQPQPPAAAASAASTPMRIPVVRIQSEEEDAGEQWVGSLPTPPTPEPVQQQSVAAPSTTTATADDEMVKKMAVMKIKQGGHHTVCDEPKTNFADILPNIQHNLNVKSSVSLDTARWERHI